MFIIIFLHTFSLVEIVKRMDRAMHGGILRNVGPHPTFSYPPIGGNTVKTNRCTFLFYYYDNMNLGYLRRRGPAEEISRKGPNFFGEVNF
jgi:hypothetical protein